MNESEQSVADRIYKENEKTVRRKIDRVQGVFRPHTLEEEEL